MSLSRARKWKMPRGPVEVPDPIDWSECPLARAFPRDGKRAPWMVGSGRYKRVGR